MLENLFRSAWADLCIPIGLPNPFRLLQLASIGLDGRPKARTVVMREANEQTGTLTFYLDSRSAKYKEISHSRFVALSSFDPLRTVQLRMEGEANFILDAESRHEHWESLKPASRELFGRACSPGIVINGPNEFFEDNTISDEHFSVLTVTITEMEWLDTSKSRHIRCRFARLKQGWRMDWLAP